MERRRGRRGNPPCSRQRQEDIIFLARKIREMQRHGRLESGSVVKLIMEFLNLSKSTVTKYRVDNIIRAAGHKVLRLPPYHCHYNPIEMVWNDCKRYYKTHIGKQFDRHHVKEVWQNALRQVTAEKWENYVQHTEKIVEKDWHREVKWDSMDVEPMIINVGEDSSSDEENEDDSEPLAFPLPGPSGEGC